MLTSWNRLGTALVLCASFSSASYAASIEVQTQSLGVNTTRPASQVSCFESSTGPTAVCANNDTEDILGETASANARAHADLVTGVVETTASGNADGSFAEGALSPLAEVTISENFLLEGTATFGFALDGSWDLFRLGGAFIQHNNQARLSIFSGGTLIDFDLFTPDINDPTETVAQTLTASVTTSILTEISVEWFLLNQIVIGQGLVDFGSTGLLFIDTAPGTTLFASDSTFLANQQFGVVPLPSALLLLASALGLIGLAVVRRQA